MLLSVYLLPLPPQLLLLRLLLPCVTFLSKLSLAGAPPAFSRLLGSTTTDGGVG